MVKFIQHLSELSETAPSEVVTPPAAATSTRRSSTATLEGRSLTQPQPTAKGEAALKVLNSLVQDPEFSSLADCDTKTFFREIIKQGAGGETVKQLGLATNKYDFLEILGGEARRKKDGPEFTYQLRQVLLAKIMTSSQNYKIGRIWA